MRRVLVRFGLGAIGAIYVAVGIVSARVAFLGAKDREAGVPGALRFLLQQPHGVQILAAVVAGLGGLALARLAEAAKKRIGLVRRIGLMLNGVGYGTLAWAAARMLFHVRAGSGSLQRGGIAWLIGEPWGATLLEVVGACVIAGGAFEAFQGLRGRALFGRRRLPWRLERLLGAIARFGLLARGLVLGALGYFLIRAAEELDANRVASVGGALRAFSHAAGAVFMGVVALGLSAYGLYMWTLMLLQRRL